MPFSEAKSMNFCAAGTVHAILHAIMEKDYGGKCESDPSAFVRLAMPLQNRIRQMINQLPKETLHQPLDWEAKILEPIIVDFEVEEDFGISAPDTEYMVLVGACVILAYEVLLLPTAWQDSLTQKLLTRLFDKFVCEPDICQKLLATLRVEQRRLECVGAPHEVQKAVEVLQILVPEVPTLAWKANCRELLDRAKTNNTWEIRNIPAFSELLTAFPQDLRVEVFLKPGCSMPFDYVESVSLLGEGMMVKTCIGLRMQVEQGIEISGPSGNYDTVVVEGSTGTDRVATITIPPEFSFRVPNVEIVADIQDDPTQTLIETNVAFLHVFGGEYSVLRRDCPKC